jgi:hypothetical protein
MDFSGNRGAFLGIGILLLCLGVTFLAGVNTVSGIAMLIAAALFFGAALGKEPKGRKPGRR